MTDATRPKCTFCDDAALDGHLTCGRICCPESQARAIRDAAYRHQLEQAAAARSSGGCPHCGYRHPPDGMCV